MKVLVHFDHTGQEALGLWWVARNGEIQNLYRYPASPEALRGRLVVTAKTNPELGWHQWFDRLANRPPYFEVWACYDSMNFTPEQLLRSLNPVPAALAG